MLTEIATPLLDGLEAARQIRKDLPDPKLLPLSAHPHAAFVKQVTEWAQRDFLLKQTSSIVAASAICEVQKENTLALSLPAAFPLAIPAGLAVSLASAPLRPGARQASKNL